MNASSVGWSSTSRLKWAATFGLMVALGMFILVGFVGPDAGFDAASLLQAFGIAVVIAAVPIAVMIRRVDDWRVVSLGGAMTAAGIGTIFGGNLAGFLMGISGAAILLVGASQQPRATPGLLGRLVVYAVLLILAMLFSLGDSGLAARVVAFLLAGVVATSSLWDRPQAVSGDRRR